MVTAISIAPGWTRKAVVINPAAWWRPVDKDISCAVHPEQDNYPKQFYCSAVTINQSTTFY